MTYSEGSVDPDPLIVSETPRVDQAVVDVGRTLQAIRQSAHNAQIVLVGYPQVVHAITIGGVLCSSFDQFMVDFFNQMTDRLDDKLAQLAQQQTNVAFVDPRSTFKGKEACSPTDEWINALVLSSSSGSGSKFPGGAGSFHPKPVGQNAYADLVKAAIPKPVATQ
jgi:hypothetical protein